jgi:uncharacterized membrane protein YedE/YeeE
VRRLVTLAIGACFGFALSRIGFTSWDEVHRMFVFGELRMLFAFALSIPIASAAWFLCRRLFPGRVRFPVRSIHKGTLAGASLFGAGWALSGACPSIALVQLGEGQLAAVLTIVGIFAGNWLYAHIHQRYLRWDVGSCLDG